MKVNTNEDNCPVANPIVKLVDKLKRSLNDDRYQNVEAQLIIDKFINERMTHIKSYLVDERGAVSWHFVWF